LPTPGLPAITYSPSGAITKFRFPNSASTEVTLDTLNRPASVTARGFATSGAGFQDLWTSGEYHFDGVGNIERIGSQDFAYDLASRLIDSKVLPQSTVPTQSAPYRLTSSFDGAGNMLSQQASIESPLSVPPGLTFSHTFGASLQSNLNQAQDSFGRFAYDADGAVIRAPNTNEDSSTSMLWDSQGRLTAFFNGTPESHSRPAERYAYDSVGFRLLRFPESGDGKPVVSIRNALGRTTSEFVVEGGDLVSPPRFDRENDIRGGTAHRGAEVGSGQQRLDIKLPPISGDESRIRDRGLISRRNVLV
jgi:hypothetical protein